MGEINICQRYHDASEVTLNVMGEINIPNPNKNNKAWTLCIIPGVYSKWVNMYYINTISIKV